MTSTEALGRRLYQAHGG